MSELDLSSKTVVQLRKIAKEMNVTLGAGVSKAGIVEKLRAAMQANSAADMDATAVTTEKDAKANRPATPPPAMQKPSAPAPRAAAPSAALTRPSESRVSEPAAPQPQFRAAWHNPAPRHGGKTSYPAAPQPQQGFQRPSRSSDAPTTVHTRPTGYTPRFGPAAQEPRMEASAPQETTARSYRMEQPRYSSYVSTERKTTFEPATSVYDNQPDYLSGSILEDRQQEPSTSETFDRDYRQSSYTPRRDNSYTHSESITTNPAISEMLAAGECADGHGILELHPDGYGFLRNESLLPSSKDIYVSIAQIRRFGLRTGDYVAGKTRPQRDGDKYIAMLYITEINGIAPDMLTPRPRFDELTPIYPSRRINLEINEPQYRDMRLIDLIAPLGFGQRGLLLCPPDTGKVQLLQDFANVITRNHPDATVMVLLIDENPEDVTLFREQVTCPVLASTFDQAPENHLRLADMVLERSQRLVEQGKDVVVIIDSLTRLAKVYTSATTQPGRSTPGMVNHASLFRAKKLFGAARCIKEGGSLTVIGTMNIETSNKVDDAIVTEFNGTANMELLLDFSVARAGISPALNLRMSGTKRAEALLNPHQLEGLQLMRSIIASSRSTAAIPQLMSMMDVASTNDELLLKIKDWNQMMDQSH